jgi:DNA/RNA-binding domain of Phe-tRNA-synthetase-like protein
VSEPPFVEGEVAPELAQEWPGLRLASMTFGFVPGKSPPELRDRLRLLSDRFRGAQAIALRRQPIPQAYRIFVRHIGLEPDERRVPVEALALERMQHGGFRSRNLLDDAITIATFETGVPVVAFDADKVGTAIGLRLTGDDELLGGSGRPLSSRQIVVADEDRPLAVMSGEVAEERGVTPDTTRMVLASIQVKGVPEISVEEALWTATDILALGS